MVYYDGPDSIAFRMHMFVKNHPDVLKFAPYLSAWSEIFPIAIWYLAALAVCIFFQVQICLIA